MKRVFQSTDEVMRRFVKGEFARMSRRPLMTGGYAENGTMQTNQDATHLLLYDWWDLVVRVPENVRIVNHNNDQVKFIVNADQYSINTTKHCNDAIRTCTPNIQLPFSALREAGIRISYDALANGSTVVVDSEPDSYRVRMAGGKVAWGSNISQEILAKTLAMVHQDCLQKLTQFVTTNRWHQYPGCNVIFASADMCIYCQKLLRLDGLVMRTQHSLGAVLLYVPNAGGQWQQQHAMNPGMYLSGWDNNESRHYFLTRLADHCTPANTPTVQAALESLKPREVVEAEKLGIKVERQGDVFFIEQSSGWNKGFLKMPVITDQRIFGDSHIATDVRRFQAGYLTEANWYVRGMITHRPDHRGARHHRLDLRNPATPKRRGTWPWYRAVKNTATGSWEAKGNVD